MSQYLCLALQTPNTTHKPGFLSGKKCASRNGGIHLCLQRALAPCRGQFTKNPPAAHRANRSPPLPCSEFNGLLTHLNEDVKACFRLLKGL
ncbi:MAG TPA: hypothetical protein V6D30_21730 [Leptolyngbyaceae cyanobacterium]